MTRFLECAPAKKYSTNMTNLSYVLAVAIMWEPHVWSPKVYVTFDAVVAVAEAI